MSKTKQKRWSCPLCNIGVLGPLRPRKDNVIRYCLPCSAATGKLTERVAPADVAKRERKVLARAESAAKRAPKPRKTKRSWMRDPRYVFDVAAPEKDGFTFNIMEMAEKMCKSDRWNSAVRIAAAKTNPVNLTTVKQRQHIDRGANYKMKTLWRNTMRCKGAAGSYGAIRITRNTQWHATGRGGPGYGVTIGACPKAIAGTLMTLLHELVHVAHLSQMTATRLSGSRRPHDMAFNIIQWKMAKAFWGYDVHPYEAGWSIGKGYSPSRHLDSWLAVQLANGNPKVTKWFTANA